MKTFKNIFIILLGVMVVSSCKKKISELEANPNNPQSVTPNLILGTVLTDLSGTGTAGSLGGTNAFDAVHRWNQYHCSNYSYYNDNIYSWESGPFDGYLVLKNVVQMETEARARGVAAVNPYEAVGKFIRAYYYYNLTSMFGDIPQADALEASKNPSPAYTPQKQVFQYVLNILDSANTDFATLIAASDHSLSASQDIFYGGSLASWQKLVNSFKLRVLISLSNQASDADLQVATQFANIFNNPSKYPVFQSQGDDFKFVYLSATYSPYYFNSGNYNSIATRYNMAATYVGALTGLKDPRVYITSEPAWELVSDSGYAATDFRAFVGASTGEAIGDMYNLANEGKYSFINRYRYFTTFVGEPDVLVGYKELQFNIAEAINRGWITGNAETYYKQGITESINFYGIKEGSNTAAFVKSGAVTDTSDYSFNFNFNTYYAQPSVQYAGGSTGLNQILLQKYIASFENSGWESYFTYRRTGVPAFMSGTGVGNNGVIPKRWAYPVNEQSFNATNWKAALTNQGFSADDLNQTMWLIK